MTDTTGRGLAVRPPAPLGDWSRGPLGVSTTLPMLKTVVEERRLLEAEFLDLASQAARARSLHKSTRANLITTLRVFGNEGTGGMAIKTSAERNEWADADADVQAAELAADLLDERKRAAKMAWDTLDHAMRALNSAFVMERAELEQNRQPGMNVGRA